MRIIIISDTHGNFGALDKIVSAHIDTADLFIHLGDGEREVEKICLTYPEIKDKFLSVAGNCDTNSLSLPYLLTEAGGHRVIAVHGHRQGVAYSLDNLKALAKANGCDIVLYGHTHCRFNSYENGLYIMNPGSASSPRDFLSQSYGVIDAMPDGVLMNIAEVCKL